MEETQQIEDASSETVPDKASEENHETRDEMLSRHRKEISQLQNKEIELKKAAARGSKAEQKVKKKQVEEEISQLSAKLKKKHTEELASLGYSNKNSNSNGNEKNNLDNLVKAIAGVSMTAQSDHSKPSKSTKRREKRAQQEAERDRRIEEEQSNIVSDRMVENEQLEKKLGPLGLTVHEIKPDGHCLYRAVENQLAFLSDNTDDSLAERFENYCKEVESTAAWGGQLELGALTHCLQKHIMIFSGSFPDVEMGKEYKSEGLVNSSIRLSYHKHAFGLGEHYNSVVPV